MNRLMMAVAAAVVAGLALVAAAQERQEFPAATPESVGVPRRALELLDEEVRGYIERGEAVGAEVMVIKNRKTVWHAAHGLADRENKTALAPGSIYCIRSMTKSFIGTAVQMLIDDGKLSLDDPAAKHLPAFDTDTHRGITVRHLLEHRSGLPLSSLMGVDHRTLSGVQDVARLAAKAELRFAPGEGFNYSDDGADTLTAIVEKVSGGPAEAFIEDRIIKPLGLRDTITVVRDGDPRAARMIPAYSGGAGEWTPFWAPGDTPLFPYLLGSQSMYSTCEDYARLLCLWADKGRLGDARLLSEAAVERGLAPRSDMGRRSGPDHGTFYGQLWQVRTEGAEGTPATRVAFGHGGSDGTIAWMWPERDLIVLYFTQSRGGMSVFSIDQAVDRYLIRGELEKKVIARRDARPLEGVYWSDERGRYVAVTGADQKLRAEIQGQTAVDLVPSDGGDNEWQFELRPELKVRFEREREGDGPASALVMTTAKGEERRFTRLDAAPDLPTAAHVAAKVKSAHGLSGIRGVIRREGTIKTVGGAGPMVSYLSSDAARSDLQIGPTKVRAVRRDGRTWVKRGAAPADELTGPLAAAATVEQPQFIFGGWLDAKSDVRVLKRITDEGRPLLLVRATLPEARGTTLFVDEATWRVVRQDRIVDVPPFGPIGITAEFEFFEPVGGAGGGGGVVLPRTVTGRYATPQLGINEVRFEKIEVLEGAADVFKIEGD